MNVDELQPAKEDDSRDVNVVKSPQKVSKSVSFYLKSLEYVTIFLQRTLS